MGKLKMLDIGVSEILSNQERGKRIDRGHLFPPRPPPCLLSTHSSKIFTLDEMWKDLVHLETFIIFRNILTDPCTNKICNAEKFKEPEKKSYLKKVTKMHPS